MQLRKKSSVRRGETFERQIAHALKSHGDVIPIQDTPGALRGPGVSFTPPKLADLIYYRSEDLRPFVIEAKTLTKGNTIRLKQKITDRVRALKHFIPVLAIKDQRKSTPVYRLMDFRQVDLLPKIYKVSGIPKNFYVITKETIDAMPEVNIKDLASRLGELCRS